MPTAGAAGAINTAGGAGGDSYICPSSSSCGSVAGIAVVLAKGGGGGLVGNGSALFAAGGASGSGIGTTRYSGGNSGTQSNDNSATGGGGAAGPAGAGGAGGNINGPYQAGSGGGGANGGATGGAVNAADTAGAGGSGGGGGGGNSSTEAGGAGSTNGVSGGGGGGGYGENSVVAGTGGNGGGYGGGGGGGGGSLTMSAAGGAGSSGIIVITYTPSSSTTPPPPTSATRTSSFAYDPATGLRTQEVVEPDTPAMRLQTDYGYDSFGNKISVTASGTDIVTRTDGSSYDAKGEFVSSNTNALGQSESFQYDPRFGQPTSHTGPNGLTTTRSYDGFGRKILEILPDGTQTKWAYLFCSGVNGGTATCPAGATYLIQTTPYAADGATVNGPAVLVYCDLLNREVARDTKGFDGSTIRATTTYDALGRVLQTSRPYFLSGGTPQLTTYTYDVLGRVVTRTLPDGSVSRTAYHGLTVSKTNSLNQTRTATNNSQGLVVSVTDALGKTMTYAYDPFGNLAKTTDAVGNVVTTSYDRRGGKIGSSDPDLGNWSYSYNTLGLLVSQTNAKNQATTLTYDKLDRLVQQIEPDMTSVWVYDTAAHGIGKLASTGITAGPGNGDARSTSYDALGRAVQVATAIDGATYTMGATYDVNGRLAKVSYPSGFTARYAYTARGDASQLLDDATGQAYWTANAMDAELHLLQQTAGNGLITTNSFDAATGRLTGVATGSGATVQNLSFTYDRHGNPLSRSDANTSLSETFTYDALNRLTASTVNLSPTPLSKTFTYDPIGNLLSKSDVGTYSYPAPGSPQPHAVMSVGGGSISTTFTYDANGNQTSGLGRSMVFTSYNKPASITLGARTIRFLDDTDHQRFKQVTPEGTTLYISAFGVLTELTNPGAAAQKWTDYLSVGGAQVGVRVLQSASETLTTRYFHTDHLGSISVITNENGVVQERLSYDAWGKRRFPNGTDDPTGSIASQSKRGFTGEEELSVSGLVHLNGRVYDPILARMTSADPDVLGPMNAQNWNRYSYVNNRALKEIDPTGYDYIDPQTGLWVIVITSPPPVGGIGGVGGCNCPNSGNNPLGISSLSQTPSLSDQIAASAAQANAQAMQTVANMNAMSASLQASLAASNAAAMQMNIDAGNAALQAAQAAPLAQTPAPPISDAPPGYQPTPGQAAPNSSTSAKQLLSDGTNFVLDPGVQASIPGVGGLAVGAAKLFLGAASAYGRVASRIGAGRFVKDVATRTTKNWSGMYKSEGEARALAREKLGTNPVEVEPNKWRSADGKWQYRAKPGDVLDNHVHLEELDPNTGEVLQNLHLRWPEGTER